MRWFRRRRRPHRCVGLGECCVKVCGWNHPNPPPDPGITYRGVSRCTVTGQAWQLVECGPVNFITYPIDEERVAREVALVAELSNAGEGLER